MSNPKFILFNAPPRAGKDTCGIALYNHMVNTFEHNYNPYRYKFATPLKTATHSLYNLDVTADHYEDIKENRIKDFLGLSPREAYIKVSEEAIKPAFGKDFFGQVATIFLSAFVDQPSTRDKLFIITDCGFIEELKPLVERFGVENFLIIQLMRDGCTFVCDSRSYIEHPDITTVQLSNDGNIITTTEQLFKVTEAWLNGDSTTHTS